MGTIDDVGESVADLASPLLLALLLCFIAATAVSSTIVDVSPFSTNSALALANAPESVDRNRFLRQLAAYGALVTVLAPVVLWLVFVVVLGEDGAQSLRSRFMALPMSLRGSWSR